MNFSILNAGQLCVATLPRKKSFDDVGWKIVQLWNPEKPVVYNHNPAITLS